MAALLHAIQLQNISYKLPNGQFLFENINLTIPQEKIGIIGRNGTGKTTLCKLLNNELIANSGQIIKHNLHIVACPQSHDFFLPKTVAEILEIQDKFLAYKNILKGDLSEKNYETLNEDWDFLKRIQNQLANFGLKNIVLEKSFVELSGGQRTALLLAKYFYTYSDFLLLDEPTNNLDTSTRNHLYQAIQQTTQGLLIISHDRQLLELMDRIIEVTSIGINIYGGNYSAYKQQKASMSAAALHEYEDAKKLITKTKQNIQTNRERHEQKQAYGRQLRRERALPKIVLNGMKGRSERTQSDLLIKSTRLIKHAKEIMTKAKEKIEILHEFKFDLSRTFVPRTKLVFSMENIYFNYQVKNPLIQNFNYSMFGPKRIAIVGDNGSGKSTLIKLLIGELIPNNGTVLLGINQFNYLDQHCSQLNFELSILDNFLQHNPDYSSRDAHFVLATFLFRNKDAEKLVKQLSGGEKLRALLACILFSKTPPQLLILDELTNHLDLESIESIENALKLFEGAMILISHDRCFLENCGVSEYIVLAD